MRYLLFLLLFLSLFAGENSELLKRGKKVVNLFCKKETLPKFSQDLNATINLIKESNACGKLNEQNLKAVALYLQKGAVKSSTFIVPKDAKCPVCGMFVHKYPKWASLMEINGKMYYFDGVKDMMKFYFFDKDFPYDRTKISQVLVRDYYTLESVDATKAFYVIDSNILGPMGHELIGFKTKKEAENFINDHKGRIIKFQEITVEMVEGLDAKH